MSSRAASASADLAATPHDGVWVTRVGGAAAGLGAVLCIAALFDVASWPRFSHAYLWAFALVWTIVLGCLFFIGLQHITGSIWSVVIRRVAEALAAPMWLIGVLFVPVLVFLLWNGRFELFPWADHDAMATDHLLHQKQAYLNVPFFVTRAVVFFAIWIGFARYFVRGSLRQDHTPNDVQTTLKLRRAAVPFTLLFGITATFAGIDWLMSLSPKWYSTIFGVYLFAGMVVAALSAIIIVTVWLRAAGRLSVVTDEHLYSLGALLFGFVCFWAYIAFSQYMLIWYANLPEETFYLNQRAQGGWGNVSVALALLRFAIPFVLLLSRRAKMNGRILIVASILMLAGQALDLYWLIMPGLHRDGPVFGWQELGPLLLTIGLLVIVVSRFLARHAPLAVGDPLLEDSRRFHL